MDAQPDRRVAWSTPGLLEGEAGDIPGGADSRLQTGAAAIPSDIARFGPELLAQSWVEFFKANPDAEVVMRAARRAGIPWSEAVERWADPNDIAAEMGLDALDAARADARCDQCGTDPDSIIDPQTGKLLEGSRMKLEMRSCRMCEIRNALDGALTTDERKAGLSWTVTRRNPGDPFEDRAGQGLIYDDD